ncbi:hypothetical protein SLS64_013422 [Diaporthe eres]|uniref:Uncharacterized protein n=1 Tax=Diaporthe eres TaxID=83184 RepID=A0ABR1NUA2_DIAER
MRFSYAVVALFGAAHAMPRVGNLVTGRSVCNSEDCKGVARAVVADQAALEARKKSKQAKGAAANATAADANNKRSKKLFQVEARANETDVEARALGDSVDTLVGDVTGTVGDVAGTVGLKTREGKEVRAAVTDDAAIDARQQSKQAKSAAANGTAEARGLHKNEERAAVTDDAAIDARQQSKEAKSAAANGTAEARSVHDNKGRSANLMHGVGAEGKLAKKEATAAADGAESRKSRKSRKSRRSHQLW